MRSLQWLINQYYACRPCFICELAGLCGHRQLDIAIAEIDNLEELNRKPIQSEETRLLPSIYRAVI